MKSAVKLLGKGGSNHRITRLVRQQDSAKTSERYNMMLHGAIYGLKALPSSVLYSLTGVQLVHGVIMQVCPILRSKMNAEGASLRSGRTLDERHIPLSNATRSFIHYLLTLTFTFDSTISHPSSISPFSLSLPLETISSASTFEFPPSGVEHVKSRAARWRARRQAPGRGRRYVPDTLIERHRHWY